MSFKIYLYYTMDLMKGGQFTGIQGVLRNAPHDRFMRASLKNQSHFYCCTSTVGARVGTGNTRTLFSVGARCIVPRVFANQRHPVV